MRITHADQEHRARYAVCIEDPSSKGELKSDSLISVKTIHNESIEGEIIIRTQFISLLERF